MPTHALTLLDGYDFVSHLGRGAGAAISLATQVATKRLFVVKHVVRHSDQDDKFIAQAETEYEISHQLEHPYLRRCYDIVRIRKWLKVRHLFLIMEYVDGVRLEDRRPKNLAGAIAVFRRVADGLGAMHDAGFVHADIKPNNILLSKGGGLKIIDFGQSCAVGHVKTRVQGTPDYIAPEQVLRHPIDRRTDVFNLGATMYWILTGKFFITMIQNAPAGSKRIEIESMRGNEPPHTLDRKIPVALSRLVMECCETQPDRRPRDMKQLTSRLDTIELMMERKPEQAS